nr:hypothetical protein [Pseudomonas sp. UBA6718]
MPQSFEVLRRVGLSSTCMHRLERYRRRQQKQGAAVLVLSWPDGTWCVLALHLSPLCPLVLTREQIADAYTCAFEWIAAGKLPLLVLRPIFQA